MLGEPCPPPSKAQAQTTIPLFSRKWVTNLEAQCHRSPKSNASRHGLLHQAVDEARNTTIYRMMVQGPRTCLNYTCMWCGRQREHTKTAAHPCLTTDGTIYCVPRCMAGFQPENNGGGDGLIGCRRGRPTPPPLVIKRKGNSSWGEFGDYWEKVEQLETGGWGEVGKCGKSGKLVSVRIIVGKNWKKLVIIGGKWGKVGKIGLIWKTLVSSHKLGLPPGRLQAKTEINHRDRTTPFGAHASRIAQRIWGKLWLSKHCNGACPLWVE